jgi:Fe2+ transport system protein FeoA
MRLSECQINKKYILKNVFTSKNMLLRLASIGLFKDVIFSVIKNDIGPIIISIKAIRISIGRDLSKKIEVEKT